MVFCFSVYYAGILSNTWFVYFKLMFIDVSVQKDAFVKQDKYRRRGPREFDEFNRETEVAKEKTGSIVRQFDRN